MNMKKYTVETVVDEENTALAVGSGDMEVFATPMMIALMEMRRQPALQMSWEKRILQLER